MRSADEIKSIMDEHKITIQNGTEIIEIEQKYLDYSSLSQSEYELVTTILEKTEEKPEGLDIHDIENDWISKNKRTRTVSGGYKHHPDHDKTIYRCMKKLKEGGYINSKGGRPKKYSMDENQKLMYEITKPVQGHPKNDFD